MLAVPGSIYSAQSQGTNELLRSGRAGVLCQAADVLACMGVESESAAPEQSAFAVEQTSPDAQAVYAALGPTPKGVDELAAATACPPAGCWPPVPNWSCTAVHKVSRDGAMSPCKI